MEATDPFLRGQLAGVLGLAEACGKVGCSIKARRPGPAIPSAKVSTWCALDQHVECGVGSARYRVRLFSGFRLQDHVERRFRRPAKVGEAGFFKHPS